MRTEAMILKPSWRKPHLLPDRNSCSGLNARAGGNESAQLHPICCSWDRPTAPSHSFPRSLWTGEVTPNRVLSVYVVLSTVLPGGARGLWAWRSPMTPCFWTHPNTQSHPGEGNQRVAVLWRSGAQSPGAEEGRNWIPSIGHAPGVSPRLGLQGLRTGVSLDMQRTFCVTLDVISSF